MNIKRIVLLSIIFASAACLSIHQAAKPDGTYQIEDPSNQDESLRSLSTKFTFSQGAVRYT